MSANAPSFQPPYSPSHSSTTPQILPSRSRFFSISASSLYEGCGMWKMSMPDLSSAARRRQSASVSALRRMLASADAVLMPSLLNGAPAWNSSATCATSLRKVSSRPLTRSRKLSLYFSSLPPFSSSMAWKRPHSASRPSSWLSCSSGTGTSKRSSARYFSRSGSKRASVALRSSDSFLCRLTTSASWSSDAGTTDSASRLLRKCSCSADSSDAAIALSRPVNLLVHASQCPTSVCLSGPQSMRRKRIIAVVSSPVTSSCSCR
eukprot:363771-Chlamydomonas_euryale.AAC.17